MSMTLLSAARSRLKTFLPASLRGILRRAKDWPFLPLGYLLGAVVVLLRPLVRMRFHAIWSDRIGHMAVEPDVVLARMELEGKPAGCVDLFYYSGQTICNAQLMRMQRRAMHISPIFRLLHAGVRLTSAAALHETPWHFGSDSLGVLPRTAPRLKFLPGEIARGEHFMTEKLGWRGEDVVCFFNRDSAYLATHTYRDFSYHDYRDSSIYRYVAAMEQMVGRGYIAVRAGAKYREVLPADLPGIVDYASRHRTDFMDIFLFWKCRFAVGTSTGLGDLARIFRKPLASANCAGFLEMTRIRSDREIFIPKLYVWAESGDPLTLSEIRRTGAGFFGKSEQFGQAGIALIENSAEEIEELAIEMDARVKGTWQATPADRERQAAFWAICGISDDNVVPVGTKFLRRYEHILH